MVFEYLIKRSRFSFISLSFPSDCSFYVFCSMQALPNSQSQTVVVENPMSVDKSGKLVNQSLSAVLIVFSLPVWTFVLKISQTYLGKQCRGWSNHGQKVIFARNLSLELDHWAITNQKVLPNILSAFGCGWEVCIFCGKVSYCGCCFCSSTPYVLFVMQVSHDLLFFMYACTVCRELPYSIICVMSRVGTNKMIWSWLLLE